MPRLVALGVAALAAAAMAWLYFHGPREGPIYNAIVIVVGIGLIAALLEPFAWLIGVARGKSPTGFDRDEG